MKIKITKRSIDSAKATTKDTFLWDIDTRGFGLKITPLGRKVFILQYRMGGRGTIPRRYTIGAYGPLTPEGARKEAKKLLVLVLDGKDPAAIKRTNQGIPTLNVFADRYLKEYAEVYKKPRSIIEDRRNLDLHVKPALGTRRIDTLTGHDLARLHHNLRNIPITANRVRSLLMTMFRLAEKWGLRPDGSNPCRHVQKYPERKRQRFLSLQELGSLGKILSKVELSGTYSPFVIGSIRLLLLTGARLNEVLTLQWSEVDLENQALHLPDSKTGQKSIYLNPAAIALLNRLLRVKSNPYVFPGQRPRSHLKNIQRAWREIRNDAGLPGVRLHDLRHSFASVGAASGLGLPIIGALLGHSQAATTHRYAHLAADPLKQAADIIGSQIEAAMINKPKAKVVPLKKKGGRK